MLVKIIRNRAAMHRMIFEQLPTMRNLETKPQDRVNNCWSGHRGAINPTTAGR